MPDVRVRDRETGEERVLPKGVADLQRSRFQVISEEKDSIQKPQNLVYAPGTGPDANKADSPNQPAPNVEQEEKKDVDAKGNDDLDGLRKQYEEKFGSKPHHKMKSESLLKALEK